MPAYIENFNLSADYALIASVIKTNPLDVLIKVDFPLCRFRMGGANESRRFQAIKEDLTIRRNILGLSWLEANWLYFLHFNHAIVKNLFKKTRFLRHKEVSTG
jgi:putative colanic acid biosynthesis glycosyltransferase